MALEQKDLGSIYDEEILGRGNYYSQLVQKYIDLTLPKSSEPMSYKEIQDIVHKSLFDKERRSLGYKEELFIKRFNLENEVETLQEAILLLFGGDVGIKLEVMEDAESEDWKTLLFKIFKDIDDQDFINYQERLVKQFLKVIKPGRRKYFSLMIESP